MSDDNSPRRTFLKTAGAVGAFTILNSRLVRGSEANSAVRIGLAGCGRRGMTHAKTLIQHTSARMTALADLFQDQIDAARPIIDAASAQKGSPGIAKTWVGPHACRQMAESDEVDAVVVATPAYFHPEHLRAVVEAHKHIYLEKPVAIDVAGTRRVLETAKLAEGKTTLDVGFQIRSAPPYVEIVRRIQAGALGDIVAAEAHYFCPNPYDRYRTDATGDNLRVRNWIQDRVLSGDIIVEQDIHVIDVANWTLQSHPLSAVGRGNRTGRNGPGDDCYSHFDVIFRYPNDVHLSFNSTQFGKGPFEVSQRFFGTRGAAQLPYSGPFGIDGDEKWMWAGSESQGAAQFSASGAFTDNLAQADSEKKKSFIDSITSGNYHNQAAQGVESALTAMLGRQAGYLQREVTWDEFVNSNQHWDAKIDIDKLG
ncbi:MAG TPA: Gfo/Idh/MocA family oxidoreductase [Bryobacteraceae bacterium]|jgi:predicted dehydrogenase|nr:Gfo/Idh/MocA family oxidoreductase [Bryobacteraceae bacterium]